MPKDTRTGLEIFGPVNEGTAAEYEAAELLDQSGNVVTNLSEATLTATIFDRDTNRIITAEKSILNTGGGTFSAGKLILVLAPADNPVLNQRKEFEEHLLKISWSFLGGVTGNHEVIIRVRNMRRVAE
jgi:hypothetical protein